MRHFISLTAALILFAAPASAQMKANETTPNPTCAYVLKSCPDGSYMAPSGVNCEIPPCGGYPHPADPYRPPVGATGHYTMPVKPITQQGVTKPPVNTCNNEYWTCPDGTIVKRVPPMCNFARCPVTEEEEPEVEEPPVEEETPVE